MEEEVKHYDGELCTLPISDNANLYFPKDKYRFVYTGIIKPPIVGDSGRGLFVSVTDEIWHGFGGSCPEIKAIPITEAPAPESE